MPFKVGNEIKLTNYKLHSDWERHEGQTATIVEADPEDNPQKYAWGLQWEDGTRSCAPTSHLIPIFTSEIDKVVNNEIRRLTC